MPEATSTTLVRYDLAHYGRVTAVTSPTVFNIGALAGFGDAAFAGGAPYSVYVLRDVAGLGAAPQGELRTITAYVSTGGLFTVTAAFTVPVAVGDEVLVLHPSVANSLKTSGQAPVVGSTTANWQAAEANLITLGANDVRNKVHSLIVGIQNLIGNITIRLYTQVNGVERQVWPTPLATTFIIGTDGPAIAVINGTWRIHEALRVTVQSDSAPDNGAAVTYDAMLESM